MSQATDDVAPHQEQARGFGAVHRTELRILRPDLALPPLDETAADAALEVALASRIDACAEPMAALCLSGGGIRSASFALGVLQGLARFGLLQRFHYLSTVSGGGYIGSWLSAWRARTGDPAVFAGLNAAERQGHDTAEIAGIRADSNYLTPTLGLLSADTWTVIILFFRNLLLNWLMFMPFFAGCLLFPYLCRDVNHTLVHHGGSAVCWVWAGRGFLFAGLMFAVLGRFRMRQPWLTEYRFLWLVLLPLVVSGICFTAAGEIAGYSRGRGLDFCVDWLDLGVGSSVGLAIYAVSWLVGRMLAGRQGGAVLVKDLIAWVAAGSLVGALIELALQIIAHISQDTRSVVVLGLSAVLLAYLAGDILYAGLSSFSRRGDLDREWLARASGWIAAILVGWALVSSVVLFAPDGLHLGYRKVIAAGLGSLSGIATALLGSSARTAATKAMQTLTGMPMTRVASLAAVLCAVFLAAWLSLFGQWLTGVLGSVPDSPSVLVDCVVMALLIGFAFIVSLPINVNRFSLHALYRNRLVRAFLGSARADDRRADPFTGFDPNDNLKLAETAPVGDETKLFHVINAALNVVKTDNPAWQERKAESFAMTRHFCGNPAVRFQPTAQYGDRHGGLTLGTAMAISGAAVSPNQGYASSPLVGFLLMLFNVRLGWWLGNPKLKYFSREGPIWGIAPALKELAGATTAEGNWVYLSDGGHFENLGLYEMIRRRCRFIVVSDAGCDPEFSFEDLGNAVRKIYIDFGVSIDFKKLSMTARKAGTSTVCCAVATIKYPNSDKLGYLLYLKPTYPSSTGHADIRGYALAHPEFPHESTTDQWFSESQLEAYRALGANAVECVCGGGLAAQPGQPAPQMTLADLQDAAEHYLGLSLKPAPHVPFDERHGTHGGVPP